MTRFLITIFCATFINESLACSEPNFPDLENIEKYPSIYVGEVTSVSLERYENGLLAEKTGRVKYLEENRIFYSMNAVVSETVRGEQKNLLSNSFSHCGTLVPNLRDTGIFFVTESNEILPVYSSDARLFLKAIREIEKLEH